MFGLRRGSRDHGHDFLPKELHISRGQCRDLADCPMSAAEYFAVLHEKGLIRDDA